MSTGSFRVPNIPETNPAGIATISPSTPPDVASPQTVKETPQPTSEDRMSQESPKAPDSGIVKNPALSGLWKSLDANKDRLVSRGEVETFANANGITQSEATEFVEQLDSDRSDEIDIREFAAMDFTNGLMNIFMDAVKMSVEQDNKLENMAQLGRLLIDMNDGASESAFETSAGTFVKADEK